MKKKVKIILLVIAIIIFIVGASVFCIYKAIEDMDVSEFLKGTEGAYEDAEYFRDLVCVKKANGIFEYINEEGDVILQIEADDASNIIVTLSNEIYGVKYKNNKTILFTIEKRNNQYVEKEVRKLSIKLITKNISNNQKNTSAQYLAEKMLNIWNKIERSRNKEYEEKTLAEIEGENYKTFEVSKYDYEYYLYDEINGIIIQQEWTSYNQWNYNVIDLKNNSKITLDIEKLNYNKDGETIILDDGKIPYWGENDNGYFQIIVQEDSKLEINKVSVGKEYRIIQKFGDYYVIESTFDNTRFFTTKNLQRVSQIFSDIQVLGSNSCIICWNDEQEEKSKFIDNNLRSVSKEYMYIWPTNNTHVFFAVTERKSVDEKKGKLINLQGEEIKKEEYIDCICEVWTW